MNAEISIKGLILYACIGVYEWEKVIKQEIIVDIYISYSICDSKSCMKCKVDYHLLCLLVRKLVAGAHYELLECLVKHILEFLVFNYSSVFKCAVTVAKSMATMGLANISCSMSHSTTNHGVPVCN